MTRFEDKIIKFTPKPILQDSYFLEILKNKRNQVLENRPKEEDFSDVYGEEEVKNDKNEIQRVMSLWEELDSKGKEAKDFSDIYEAMISDQIEKSNWFGDKCKSYPASYYDDVKNGIDIVNIFEEGEDLHYMGLGVDVCFSSKKEELVGKLESIKQCIRSGEMPALKYFKNPKNGEKKKILLPKVIVGSRFSSAEKTIRIWGGKDPNRDKSLKDDNTQVKFILETISQLKYFYDFSGRISENNTDEILKEKQKNISIEYAKMYNIFYDIYVEKKELIDKYLNEISDDIVYETIIGYTNK